VQISIELETLRSRVQYVTATPISCATQLIFVELRRHFIQICRYAVVLLTCMLWQFTGLGWTQFRKNRWIIFDLTILLIAYGELLAYKLLLLEGSTGTGTIVRSVRQEPLNIT